MKPLLLTLALLSSPLMAQDPAMQYTAGVAYQTGQELAKIRTDVAVLRDQMDQQIWMERAIIAGLLALAGNMLAKRLREK